MLPDMVKQFSLLSDKTRGAPAASTCSLAAPAGCDERGDGSCADSTAPGGDGDGAPVDVERVRACRCGVSERGLERGEEGGRQGASEVVPAG